MFEWHPSMFEWFPFVSEWLSLQLDWLFPDWSSPATVAAVVVLRLLLDSALVALVMRATGLRSRLTVGAAALTLLSAVMIVSVLRPGGLGQPSSYVELSLQFVLLVVAGYATHTGPSRGRWIALAAIAVGVLILLLPTVVLYGEATVAP